MTREAEGSPVSTLCPPLRVSLLGLRASPGGSPHVPCRAAVLAAGRALAFLLSTNGAAAGPDGTAETGGNAGCDVCEGFYMFDSSCQEIF